MNRVLDVNAQLQTDEKQREKNREFERRKKNEPTKAWDLIQARGLLRVSIGQNITK